MYDCANTAISQQFFLVNGYLCLALCCVDQAYWRIESVILLVLSLSVILASRSRDEILTFYCPRFLSYTPPKINKWNSRLVRSFTLLLQSLVLIILFYLACCFNLSFFFLKYFSFASWHSCSSCFVCGTHVVGISFTLPFLSNDTKVNY